MSLEEPRSYKIIYNARDATRLARPHNPSNYPLAFAHFRTLFRRYGACEVLFYRGYPLDGYSLLRDIKDRTFLLAGVNRRKLGNIQPALTLRYQRVRRGLLGAVEAARKTLADGVRELEKVWDIPY